MKFTFRSWWQFFHANFEELLEIKLQSSREDWLCFYFYILNVPMFSFQLISTGIGIIIIGFEFSFYWRNAIEGGDNK